MPIEAEAPEELGISVAINLAESSLADRKVQDFIAHLPPLELAYHHHRGLPEFRLELAMELETGNPEHVLLTPGAAGALFLLHMALLSHGSHALVMHPNYATNLETPWALGCEVQTLDFEWKGEWFFDLETIFRKVRPNTSLISITTPHNPTGWVMPWDDLMALAAFCKERNIWLLVDETYRHIPPGPFHLPAAKLNDRVISVSSVSKSLGLPGLRIGWIWCQHETLMQQLLAAKEQVILCNGILDEHLAWISWQQRKTLLAEALENMTRNRGIVEEWLRSEKQVQGSLGRGGAVAFLKLSDELDSGQFHSNLLHHHNTYVGPGHWFGFSDAFFRLGFGYPEPDQLAHGLRNISQTIGNLLSFS